MNEKRDDNDWRMHEVFYFESNLSQIVNLFWFEGARMCCTKRMNNEKKNVLYEKNECNEKKIFLLDERSFCIFS